MSKRFNSYRKGRYFRSRFREGRYLLASEATEMQLQNIDVIRQYMENSYGDIVFGQDAFTFVRVDANTLELVAGEAIYKGIPFKIYGPEEVPTGTAGGHIFNGDNAPTRVAAASGHLGPRWTISTLTASKTWALVLERKEDLIRASGSVTQAVTGNDYESRSTDSFLQGLNVGEDTAEKMRPIYIAHFINVTDNNLESYCNEFTLSATTYNVTNRAAASGTDGQNLTLSINNAVGGKLPTTAALQEQFEFGTFVDTRGNEFTITSVATNGASIDFTIDLPIVPGTAVAPNISAVPYMDAGQNFTIKKAEYYATNSNGKPTGRTFFHVGDFTLDGTSQLVAVNTTDSDGGAGYKGGVFDLYMGSEFVTAAVVDYDRRQSVGMQSVQDHNWKLTGGGTITWTVGADTIAFNGIFYITHPGLPAQARIQVAESPINVPDGEVLYGIIDRTQSAAYDLSVAALGGLHVATPADVPLHEDVVVIAYHDSATNRLFFRENGSFGDGDSRFLGQLDDISVASKSAAVGGVHDTLDFYGATSDAGAAYSTEGSPFAIASAGGTASIQYGGSEITIGTGDGTAHPAKEWDSRADFEGSSQTVFQDVLNYIYDLDIEATGGGYATEYIGATIRLKPGDYTFTAAVQSDDGANYKIGKVRLIGSGENTRIIQSGAVSLFDINEDGWEFENITFVGDGANATALLDLDGNDIKVKNCRFETLIAAQSAMDCAGEHYEITGNFYYANAQRLGNFITLSGNVDYYVITNNRIDETNYANNFIVSSGAGVSNTIISNNNGRVNECFVTSTTGKVVNVNISNNICMEVNNAGGAFFQSAEFYHLRNITITGNIVGKAATSNGYFALLNDHTTAQTAAQNINIFNNTFWSAFGIKLLLDSTVARTIEDVVISSNIIRSSGAEAAIYIHFNGSGAYTLNNFKIDGNSINKAAGVASSITIQEDDGGVVLANVTVNNLSITNNNIVSAVTADSIIYTSDRAANTGTFNQVSISGNSIDANDSRAIYINIDNNNTFNSLKVDNNAFVSTMDNNNGVIEFISLGAVGLQNGSISRNIFRNIFSRAIYVDDAQNINIDNNNIVAGTLTAARNAIHLNSLSYFTVSGNIVDSYTYDNATESIGIYLISCILGVITGNSVKFCDTGIRSSGSNVSIGDNNINLPSGTGTSARDAVYGIYTTGAQSSITGNSIDTASAAFDGSIVDGYGIYATGNNVSISSNSITNSDTTSGATNIYGIYAAGHDSTISANSLLDWRGATNSYGIYSDLDSFAAINDNILEDCHISIYEADAAGTATITGNSIYFAQNIASPIGIESESTSPSVISNNSLEFTDGSAINAIVFEINSVISGNTILMTVDSTATYNILAANDNTTHYVSITGNVMQILYSANNPIVNGIYSANPGGGTDRFWAITGNIIRLTGGGAGAYTGINLGANSQAITSFGNIITGWTDILAYSFTNSEPMQEATANNVGWHDANID